MRVSIRRRGWRCRRCWRITKRTWLRRRAGCSTVRSDPGLVARAACEPDRLCGSLSAGGSGVAGGVGELRNVPGFAGELDAQPPGAARGEAAGSAFGGQLARDVTGGGRTGPAVRAGGDAGDQAAAQAFAADLL